MSIPILLLTGYLGAGKTTLLNRLLAAPQVRERDPALIINEFGKLGVDGKLMAAGGARTYEINKGSLFCTCTQHQLVLALTEIAGAVKPGLVIIESTGIAETRNLEGNMAIPALTESFHLAANVCVVDALNFIKVAAFLQVATGQVRWADGILISKTDQVPPADVARLQEVLRGLNPDAPQLLAPFGQDAVAFVFGLRHVERAGVAVESPPADIVAVSIERETPVDRARFRAAVANLGTRLLRLKGNIDFVGDGCRFVEVVHDRLTEAPAAPGFEARTAFTAIGWRVTAKELAGALMPTG